MPQEQLRKTLQLSKICVYITLLTSSRDLFSRSPASWGQISPVAQSSARSSGPPAGRRSCRRPRWRWDRSAGAPCPQTAWTETGGTPGKLNIQMNTNNKHAFFILLLHKAHSRRTVRYHGRKIAYRGTFSWACARGGGAARSGVAVIL